MKNSYTIKRHLESIVKIAVSQFKCTILTGPRQTGKSTLLDAILPKIRHFNFVRLDDEDFIKQANDDPRGFLELHRPPLCIDEVQKAPVLFSYMKSIIDDSDERGQYVVTGSESFELMKGVGDHLSTRAAILNMQSLSCSEINKQENFTFIPHFTEFLKRKQPVKTQLQIFKDIIKGSMPDIVNGNVQNKKMFFDSYIRSMILKDMKEDWVNIKDTTKFLKLLKVLASLVGEIIVDKTISKLTGIDKETCKVWMNGLIAMGIIFLVHPYSSSALTKTTRKPKLYFYDTGLACYLTEYEDPQTLINSDYAGHIFECYAISELSKGFINAGRIKTLYYAKKYRLSTGVRNDDNEIDLIIEGPAGVIYPIEIKMTATPQLHYFKNIKILGNAKNKIASMTLICCAPTATTLGPNKLVLPIHWL